MDLLKEVMEKGVTIAVSYVRGETSIEEKEISMQDFLSGKTVKVNVSKKVKESFDIKYIRKANGKHTFTVSKAFFEANPLLAEREAGFAEVYTGNNLYMFICDESENEFGLKPMYMNNPRGAEKRLTFTSQPLEFHALKLGLIEEEEGEWLLNLEKIKKDDGTYYVNAFNVVPATLEVLVAPELATPVMEVVAEPVATEVVTESINAFEAETVVSQEVVVQEESVEDAAMKLAQEMSF